MPTPTHDLGSRALPGSLLAPAAPPHPWLSIPPAVFYGLSAMSIVGGELGMALMLLGLLLVRPPLAYPSRELERLLLPFGVLFAAILLSALVNPQPLANLQRSIVYRLVLLPLLLLLILPHVHSRRVLQVLCVAVIAMGLYGLGQFLYGIQFLNGPRYEMTKWGEWFYRASGSFNNGLTYSGYLLLVAPPLGMLGLAERTRWRWLWLLGGALAVVGIFASLSRSAVVGLAAATLLLLFRFSRTLGLAATLAAVALVATLVVGAPIVAQRLQANPWVQQSRLLQRYVLISPSADRSSMDRILIWQAGLLGFRERPIFGFGLGNHNPELGPFQHKVVEAHGWPDYQFTVGYGVPLHNIYLRALFDLGLVGLLCYLWLWGSVLLSIARGVRAAGPGERWEAALLWGLAAGLVASMAAGVFEDNFFDGEVQTIIVAQMALSLYVSWRVTRAALARKGGPAAG